MSNPSPIDPFAPDAPLIALIREARPLVATASNEELLALVQRCKVAVQQPVTLQAELRKESDKKTGKASKLKSFLDGI